jgi:hypothetical protein
MRYFLFMIFVTIQLQRGVLPAVALMPNPRRSETTGWLFDQLYVTKNEISMRIQEAEPYED